MRRSTLLTAVVTGVATSMLIMLAQPRAWAHCEIPCGIFDDHARINQMLEDTKTIAKSIAQINELAGGHDGQAGNQLVRWVVNRDEHADKIQHTIAQYFMAQRIKPTATGTPAWEQYVTKLTLHHAVMVAAMKNKQSATPVRAEELEAAILAIAGYYPAAGGHPTTRR